MFERSLYKRGPAWLQEALLFGREFGRKWAREGAVFRRVVREIEETQWLDGDGLRDYQENQVRALLRHAATHVPYYRALFQNAGLKPETIEASDLLELPYLTKGDISGKAAVFCSRRWGWTFKGNTSGTTGTPLTIWQDLYSIVREHAFVFRILRWAGYEPGQRRAWIRGDMIVPAEQQTPPFWRMNRAAEMLMLSSYHLSEANAPAYLRALEKFDPVLIQAYPSSVGFLAHYMHSKGSSYKGCALRGIVTSSEMLTDGAKVVIEETFGCQVFDHYGSFERVALISSCEKGNLHVHEDYGFLETRPDPGARGDEIVGTGFNNRAMPLLRYRTGDRVILEDSARRCACGRQWRIVKRVEGRMDDYVVTSDGRQITRLGHIFTGETGVAEGQIVQDSIGRVNIRVVPVSNDSEELRRRIMAKATERFGPWMDVEVSIVPKIERGKNGKLQAVVRRDGRVTDAAQPPPRGAGASSEAPRSGERS